MPTATTHGFRVSVDSEFLEDESDREQNLYVFAYHVTIANISGKPAKLMTRHWIITDGNGKTEEVRGPGVVGHQPILEVGQAFQYSSGSHLRTPYGTMQGTYQMLTTEGENFDITIPVFRLSALENLN